MLWRRRIEQSTSRRCRARRHSEVVGAVVERLETRCLLSTFETAQLLVLDGSRSNTVDGAISAPGASNMYRFDAPTTGLMTIQQRGTIGSLNSELFLFDDQHRLIALDDDSGGGSDSRLHANVVAARSYFVRAAAVGGTTGGYQLQFDTLQDDVGNFFFGPSKLVPLDAAGSSDFTGQIEVPGDVDFIRFIATVTGRVTATLRSSPDSALDPDLFAYEVAVRDAQGLPRLIASNDDQPGTLDSQVVFDVAAGARYYVKASGFGDSTGTYQLAVRTTPLALVNDDAGDIAVNARVVSLASDGSGRVEGAVNSSTDVDFFAFTALVDGRMIVQTENANGFPLQVAAQAFRDSQRIASGRQIDADNNLLTFDVEAGATYQLRLSDFSDDDPAGNYQMLLTTTPDPSVRNRPVSGLVNRTRDDSLREFLETNSVVGGVTAESRQQHPADVSHRINQSIVDEMLRQFGGFQSLHESALLIWLDPVDFILTDSANRQIGYTQSQGLVNEIGSNVFYSGNGFGELLVLPVSGGSYSLQLVGVGSGAVSYGANMISPVGVTSVTGAETLFKGDSLVTLDFNQTPYTGPQAAGSFGTSAAGGIGGGPAMSVIAAGLLGAFASDAAAALALLNSSAAGTGDVGGSDAVANAMTTVGVIASTFQPRRLLGRLLNSLSVPFAEELLDDANANGPAGPAGELFDLMWKQLGGRLLGVPGRALDLTPIEKLFESVPHRPQTPPASPVPQSKPSADRDRSAESN